MKTDLPACTHALKGATDLLNLLNFFFFFFDPSFASCICPQTVLKKEKFKIEKFFEDGTSCCLPLDPAVRVKALDLEVGRGSVSCTQLCGGRLS